MTTVQMSVGSNGPVVKGLFGTYVADSHGIITCDSGEAPNILRMGGTYVKKISQFYTTPGAVAAANNAVLIASAALSNGSLTVAAQPDCMRQAALIITNGTAPVTSGTVSLSYVGNDGQTITEVLPANVGATANTTQFLSRGVAHLTSATVAGIVGGTSPSVQLGTTTTLSVPISPNTESFTPTMEATTGVPNTVGTPSAVTSGSIVPSSAPNGTRTYSWAYTTTSPNQ